jgi:hypothetical protein
LPSRACRAGGSENPHEHFTLAWWEPFLKTLQAWLATGPYSGNVLTARLLDSADPLGEFWRVACEPFLGGDISTVEWDEVAAFPALVGTLKPTKEPSPVFTSKFCHFLRPKVFPVVDNEGLGNKGQRDEDFYRYVQEEWEAMRSDTRAELINALTALIEETDSPPSPTFHMRTRSSNFD